MISSAVLFLLLCAACGDKTESIFNDPRNENNAAKIARVRKALRSCGQLIVISVVSLVLWWMYGVYYVDRDEYFQRLERKEKDPAACDKPV